MQMTRISVPLTTNEREALRALARLESRDPQEQARHILRNALLAQEESMIINRSGYANAQPIINNADVQELVKLIREFGGAGKFRELLTTMKRLSPVTNAADNGDWEPYSDMTPEEAAQMRINRAYQQYGRGPGLATNAADDDPSNWEDYVPPTV